MAPQTYVLTLTITTGPELDIALNALGNSDLPETTLDTIQIELRRQKTDDTETPSSVDCPLHGPGCEGWL